MVDQPEHQGPEILQSTRILHRGAVDRVETRGEMMKIKASIFVAAGALAVGCAVLGLAAYTGNSGLQSWATGLISAVTGAAISFGFNGRQS